MNISQFEQKLQTAQTRMGRFREFSGDSLQSVQELLADVLGDMAIALEELHVSAEELEQQSRELQAVNRALEQERKRYQELFDFAPDGYLSTDTRGVIQAANQTAIAMLKVEQPFLIGKSFLLFVIPDQRRAFHAQLASLTDGRSLKDWELQLQTCDGSILPVAAAIAPTCDETNQIIGFRWLLRDITERKQAEATRQKLQQEQTLNQLKSRFIQTASHEFRNPLSVIQMSTELLFSPRYSPTPEKRQIHLRKVRTAIRRISNMLEDMLVFSKAEAGQFRVKLSPVDLSQFCLDLIDEEHLSINTPSRVRFINRCDGCLLMLDPLLLRQLLGNLLSNALKYSAVDNPVDLILERRDEWLVIQVQDRGIGIPPGDQPYLMAPFYRAKNAETIKGNGLGLAIAKHAAELQGGAIAFESQVNQGTTFTVSLPFNPAQ